MQSSYDQLKLTRLGGIVSTKEPERIVYLAIPSETYEDFFQLSFIQRALRRYQVKLIIYDPKLEEIKQWIK
ncbi:MULTISPECIES: element excision factor XisH family protein [Planktothrix]|uniref:element excision factor XisH family protein n=1 Tax=Planktothrix TaxID=54304 RepID=UPI00040C81BF|nr:MULTISPECIES: element excision factor XisH family protein [Planktothrix]CAD0220407.1 hypothetical protein PL10110_170063 [Planktothrix agardhii]